MRIKKLLFFCLFFIFSSNNFASETKLTNPQIMEDRRVGCKTFFNRLSDSDNNRTRNFYAFYNWYDFGFWLNEIYDPNKKKFIIDKDDNGNLIVGEIYNHETASKIKPGDSILLVNDKELKTQKQFSELLLNKELNVLDIVLSNKDGKEYSVNLKRSDNNYRPVKLTIKNFDISDIDIKKSTYDITIRSQLSYLYGKQYYSSVENHPILESSLGSIIYYNENEKKNMFHICKIPEEIFTNGTMLDPSRGILIKNLLRNDKDLETINSTVTPYHELLKNDESYINITKERFNVLKIKNKFNLKSFPFDKQKIIFQIYDSAYFLETRIISNSKFSYIALNEFMGQDDIPGWKKKSYNLINQPTQGTTQFEGTYGDSILLSIELERKPGYYIFKVIFPILLILLICWSVVWVDPKELEARLTITIVCLLSLIAYNFVIDSELPKLEYLTVLDWIILISYIYATIPNLLSIISFRLLKTNLPLGDKIEQLSKRYGLASYIFLIVFIVALNANTNFEHSSSLLSWMAPR